MVEEVSDRRTYVARAVRSGDWWAISAPALRGVHSQVRRLDRVEAMAREAIALYLGVPVRKVAVKLDVVLPVSLRADVVHAKTAREKADELQVEAATATAHAARALVRGAGLTVRETGQILGVSHQRVAQLLHR